VPTGKSKLAAPTTTITPDEQVAPSASTSSLVALEPQSIEEEVNEEASAVAATEEVVMRPETPASETNTGHDETRITVAITESPSDSSNPTTPPKADKSSNIASSKTPISELLLSIERGFLFTPSAPLSPPESYLTFPPSANLAIPFPLQGLRLSSEEQNEDSGEVGDKGFELVPRLESRRTLGDVAINK
jgi:hypothetical protein